MKDNRLTLRPVGTRLSLAHISAMEFYAREASLNWSSASTLLRSIVEHWLAERGWHYENEKKQDLSEGIASAVKKSLMTTPSDIQPHGTTTSFIPSFIEARPQITLPPISEIDMQKAYTYLEQCLGNCTSLQEFITTYCPLLHEEITMEKLTIRLYKEPFIGFSAYCLTKLADSHLTELPSELQESIGKVASVWSTTIKELRPSEPPSSRPTSNEENHLAKPITHDAIIKGERTND